MFTRNSELCGGALVIAGTRVGVEFLSYWLRQYHGDIVAVQKEYPHLTLEQIQSVKDWQEDAEELYRQTALGVLERKWVTEDELREIIAAYKEAEVGIPHPGGYKSFRKFYTNDDIKKINQRLAEMKVTCGRHATELYINLILNDDTGMTEHQKHLVWLTILKVDEARTAMNSPIFER